MIAMHLIGSVIFFSSGKEPRANWTRSRFSRLPDARPLAPFVLRSGWGARGRHNKINFAVPYVDQRGDKHGVQFRLPLQVCLLPFNQ